MFGHCKNTAFPNSFLCGIFWTVFFFKETFLFLLLALTWTSLGQLLLSDSDFCFYSLRIGWWGCFFGRGGLGDTHTVSHCREDAFLH